MADLLVASAQKGLSDPFALLERLKPLLAQPSPETLWNPARLHADGRALREIEDAGDEPIHTIHLWPAQNLGGGDEIHTRF